VPFNSLRYNPLFPKKLLHLSLLEKWGAKIFAIFESFVYRITPNWTLPRLARMIKLPPHFGLILISAGVYGNPQP
jgi:hypothetical protein